MGMFIKRRKREVPMLNTSSLPDLIFTVLFFFITVTHIREDSPQVKYQVPQGSEVEKMAKKSSVIRIYIGETDANDDGYCIQINDRMVDIKDVARRLTEERNKMTEDNKAEASVTIKADRNTDMGVIQDVKRAVQKARIYSISYAATKKR